MNKKDFFKKFKFKKSLGQNFFVGKREELINLTDFSEDDIIIEVGTGTGDLTKEIAKRVKKVVTYEIDERLKDIINENIIFYKNIEIKFMDFLKEENFPEKFRFFSNLPYSISTEILKKCSKINGLIDGYFMIQKELGERITAKENSKNYGAISIFLQTFFDLKAIKIFSKNNFYPRPDVDSIFIYFKRKKLWEEDFEHYEKFLKEIFSKRRKKLNKVISKLITENLSIDLNLRPENLKVEDFLNLYEIFIRS
ncbi:MAG: 16S rRNA (adenine(1518)-N(6)/adenine(1519)-N(6))-dimethyltransferase RsmA [Caldisericia bacterium]|nr:16S rRNA (adenine(1518)-N(6)/adenine(1519)-N(6))-dimethyltransferase RsmA [Caldisericia bacterium]